MFFIPPSHNKMAPPPHPPWNSKNIFSELKRFNLLHLEQRNCIGRKGPDVSGPIQSDKMYSYAQCTVQKRSVCCRDVPCLAHIDLSTHPPSYLPGYWGIRTLLGPHRPGAPTLSTHPPSYLPGYWGISLLAAFNKDGPGQWSGHLQAAQPKTCGARKCMLILSFISI